MIKIIDGDLLKSNVDIIAHQVNCQAAMNSGVAKQIREKYPEVYQAYYALCKPLKGQDILLGDCQVVETHDGKCVANLFGQAGYGYDRKQYTDLDALKRSMCKLRNRCILNKDNITIALPYGLGSVRGGAKWEEVYAIIEEVFEGFNVEIWRLDKG